jgi:hypothetical protein
VSLPADATLVELGIEDPRWRSFVAGAADALPFNHPAWTLALRYAYRFRPLALALADCEGRLGAGIPAVQLSGRPGGRRRLVSLPFTDRCPPVGPPELRRALVEAVARHAADAGLGRVEIRDAVGGMGARVGRPAGVWHELDLRPGDEAVLAGLSSMHRRNLRHARRAGVQVRVGFGAADLRTFHRLHVGTRRRLGVPVQPMRFFLALRERLADDDLGFLVIADLRGEPVAAALFLVFNGVLVYKWGASDATAWAQRPNNLLLAEAIRVGIERGCRVLDWGRSEVAQTGLRAFKAGFGAVEHELSWGFAPPLPSPRSAHAEAVLSAVIRRSPPVVCRAIGASLYRFAA